MIKETQALENSRKENIDKQTDNKYSSKYIEEKQ